MEWLSLQGTMIRISGVRIVHPLEAMEAGGSMDVDLPISMEGIWATVRVDIMEFCGIYMQKITEVLHRQK